MKDHHFELQSFVPTAPLTKLQEPRKHVNTSQTLHHLKSGGNSQLKLPLSNPSLPCKQMLQRIVEWAQLPKAIKLGHDKYFGMPPTSKLVH